MSKRIRVLNVDGTERELAAVPDYLEMQKILGGDREMVRVLDRITPGGEFVYTALFVNETGLLEGLPRNEAATVIYQRNIREQFEGPNPFHQANAAYLSRFGKPDFDHDLTPESAKAAGYKDDPWIAGPAIYFEGYTVDEVDAALSEASRP